MQIQKKCRVARPKLAGVVQPGDAAHAQLSSRKVTGGTATPTPVRPPPQEPHLELSEPVCSWDIKSGLGMKEAILTEEKRRKEEEEGYIRKWGE